MIFDFLPISFLLIIKYKIFLFCIAEYFRNAAIYELTGRTIEREKKNESKSVHLFESYDTTDRHKDIDVKLMTPLFLRRENNYSIGCTQS